jgi:hypothetical protein
MKRLAPHALALIGLTALAGCPDDNATEAAPASPKAAAEAIPAALLQTSWQVAVADDATRAPFEAHAGWGALFMRNSEGAMSAFAADPGAGRGLARGHAELSSIYSQGALLSANATRHVYGGDRQPEIDPLAVDFVYGVSLALLGDCTAASTALQLPHLASMPELQEPLAYWVPRAGADGCGAGLGLDAPASAMPRPAEAPEVGKHPTSPPAARFTWAEQGDEARPVQVADPMVLLALARWHEAAALAAVAEEERVVVQAILDSWRLPGEAPLVAEFPAEIDAGWLFGGFPLSAADLPFLAAAPRDGVAAVEQWKASSPLAAAIAPTIHDGQVVPDQVLDQAASLGAQVEAAMAARAGSTQAFHRPMASLAHVAVLRAGMFVADGAGQYRDAGILRVNALERSTGPAGDPVFSISVAAWDAGNRNPLRSQELVHALIKGLPALEAARLPLDALHIRLSRNTASGGPVF